MKNIYQHARKLKKLSLSDNQIELINNIEFEKQHQEWTLGKIQEYLINNYPLEIFVKNYAEIQVLGRDSSSRRSYLLRFGEELGEKLFQAKCESSKITAERMIQKLGSEEEYKKFTRSRGASLEIYCERYGPEEGPIRWNTYLDKRAKAYEKKRNSGHQFPKYNLEYFQNLHGVDQGTKIYNRKIDAQRYKVSKQYYIDKYGPIDGPILCRTAKDHNSLAFFVGRYGEKEGALRYAARCVKTNNRLLFSKMSKELFNSVKLTIPDLYYYGENELVWKVREGKLKQATVMPDLFYRGKIIEFNGDVFHANPKLFKATDSPHPFRKQLTAAEIWEHDRARVEYFKHCGYQVLEVWEHDWKQNKQEVINLCIQFLTN